MKSTTLRLFAGLTAFALTLTLFSGCQKTPEQESSSAQTESTAPAGPESIEASSASSPAESSSESASNEPSSAPVSAPNPQNPSQNPGEEGRLPENFGLILPPDIQNPEKLPVHTVKKADKDRLLPLFAKTRDAELAWLADLQAPNGAIPQAPPDVYSKARVITCFSAQVCMAYLMKPEQYGGHVRRYLDWYLSHLNTPEQDPCGVDGTMFDYELTYSADRKSVRETPVLEPNTQKGHYDSTDAYAAFTLKILWEYAEACHDHAYLLAHKTEIDRLANAIYASMNDGLTWARPDYEIKYTMDNFEVWRGLSSLVKMYQTDFIPAAGAKKAEAEAAMQKHLAAANTVLDRIETEIWDEKNGYYNAGLDFYGTPYMTFDWDNHYPCAMAQIESIAMGIVQPESKRAKRLYASFNAHWSTGKPGKNWETADIDSFFLCTNNLLCGATMGDWKRTETFVNLYNERIKNGRLWPIYNADVAMLAQACQRAIDFLEACKTI